MVMATTVRLPQDLLESVDDRAKKLDMSRKRYIVRALERALDSETETGWSSRFIDELTTAQADCEARQVFEEMAQTIAARRTRKAPPRL